MKNVFAACLLALVSICACAEESAKAEMSRCQWFGSEFGMSFGGVNSAGLFTLNIAPEYGHLISSRCALGVQASLGVYASAGAGLCYFGIGPFFRYYFTNNKNFNVAADASIAVGHLYDFGGMVRVRPVFCYRFNNNWELFGKINLIEVGYFGEWVGGLRLGDGLSFGFAKNF